MSTRSLTVELTLRTAGLIWAFCIWDGVFGILYLLYFRTLYLNFGGDCVFGVFGNHICHVSHRWLVFVFIFALNTYFYPDGAWSHQTGASGLQTSFLLLSHARRPPELATRSPSTLSSPSPPSPLSPSAKASRSCCLENTFQCHVFAELDLDQPARAIVNFVNKLMMSTSNGSAGRPADMVWTIWPSKRGQRYNMKSWYSQLWDHKRILTLCEFLRLCDHQLWSLSKSKWRSRNWSSSRAIASSHKTFWQNMQHVRGCVVNIFVTCHKSQMFHSRHMCHKCRHMCYMFVIFCTEIIRLFLHSLKHSRLVYWVIQLWWWA